MDKKTRTHERILEAASHTLRRDGFRGVTVAATMKDAGLTHGGFYAHFASQDALLGEVMERAARDGFQYLTEAVDKASAQPGVSPFRAIVEGYLSEQHVSHSESGCVVSALCSELPRQNDQVREVARYQLEALVSRLSGLLEDPVSATTVVATLVGGLSIARILPPEAVAGYLESVRSQLLNRYGAR
jgi:AcrR family transcriptional regulator